MGGKRGSLSCLPPLQQPCYVGLVAPSSASLWNCFELPSYSALTQDSQAGLGWFFCLRALCSGDCPLVSLFLPITMSPCHSFPRLHSLPHPFFSLFYSWWVFYHLLHVSSLLLSLSSASPPSPWLFSSSLPFFPHPLLPGTRTVCQ